MWIFVRLCEFFFFPNKNQRGGAGRFYIIHTHLVVCECVRPPADCGHSAGGKALSAVQPCSDRRRHTLMKRFHINPLVLPASSLLRRSCSCLTYCCSLPFSPLSSFCVLPFSPLSSLCFLPFSPLSSFCFLRFPSPVSPSLVTQYPSSVCVALSLEGEQECRAVTSLAFGLRKNEWRCMVRFNTYLDYLYRFCVVWDVVAFSLLVPLIHLHRGGTGSNWWERVEHETAL